MQGKTVKDTSVKQIWVKPAVNSFATITINYIQDKFHPWGKKHLK